MKTVKRHLANPLIRISVALVVLLIGPSAPVLANGLFENQAWKFSKTHRTKLLELQELKDGGFFDQNGGGAGSGNGGGAGSGGGDTIINGPQVNCVVQSIATGNINENTADALTGTLTGVADSDISSASNGNKSDNESNGDSGIESTQENTGNVDATIDTAGINSSVGTFEGGSTNNQDLLSEQNLTDSTLSATISNSNACESIILN